MNSMHSSLKNKTLRGWQMLITLGIFVLMNGLLFLNDGSSYAAQSYLWFFLPASLFIIVENKKNQLWQNGNIMLMLFFFGCAIITPVFQQNSVTSVLFNLKVCALLLVFVFAIEVSLRNQKSFKVLLWAMVLTAAIFSWLTFFHQFFILENPFTYKAIRGSGRLYQLGWNGFADFKNPIIAGLYFGSFAVLSLFLFLSTPKLKKWQSCLLIFCMVGLFGYVLLSFSRGAWFSTLAGCLSLVALYKTPRSYRFLGVLGIFLALCVVIFWPELKNEWRRGVSGRDLIWKDWCERFSTFWLWGAGAGQDFIYSFSKKRGVIHAHSLYLQIWYEYGLLTFISFVVFLLSILHHGWKYKSHPNAKIGISLLVFACVAMMTDVYGIIRRPSPCWAYLWFSVGLLISQGVKVREI